MNPSWEGDEIDEEGKMNPNHPNSPRKRVMHGENEKKERTKLSYGSESTISIKIGSPSAWMY